jgi:hypothetical protein
MEGVSGEAIMANIYHEVKNIHIRNGFLNLIVDGKHIQRDLKDFSSLLASATEEEQKEFDVSPSGYGIHWPLIDEDVSIDGLLGLAHEPSTNRKSA